MIKFHIEKIKGYTVKGYVSVEDLSDEILEKLHVSRNDTETVDFEGEFITYASQDDAGIDGFDGLYLIGTPTGETFKGPTGKYETSICEISGITIRKQIWGDIPKTYDFDILADDSQFDIDGLCDAIVDQSDTYEWYQDEMISQAEAYYDRMKEGD